MVAIAAVLPVRSQVVPFVLELILPLKALGRQHKRNQVFHLDYTLHCQKDQNWDVFLLSG